MALSTTSITTSKVGNALGTTSRDVGSLCSSSLINPWSRWKPISNPASTLTDAILKTANYGITILSATSPALLLNAVKNNGNLGYTYSRPVGGINSPYRLGDFRGYNHGALIPTESTYKDNDKVAISGVSSSYSTGLDGISSIVPDNLDSVDYLSIGHIYPSEVTNRGALVTDGSNSYWSVGSIPWGNTYWQKFKGKSCTVLEFMTNLSNGTTSVTHTAQTTDKFYALPEPLHTISVTNTAPAGSKDVFVDIYGAGQGIQFTDTTYSTVSYNFCFSSIGEVYAGGTIKNVYIGLYKDSNCTNVIQQKKIADSITIGNEETSINYFGKLTNTGNSMSVYVGFYWNYGIQWKTMPMADAEEMPQ